MPAVTSNPYLLSPGNTTEGTLTFPDSENRQLTIEILTNGFQLNTKGAVGSGPTMTTTSAPKIILTIDRGEALSYKANNNAATALICW